MAVLLSNESVLTALAMANETREMRDSPVNGDDKSLLVAKIVAMVVLLVITTLCGAIPFILNRYYKFDNAQSPRSAKVVKCLLYFGGGVLFCTTFLHLLPEVLEVCDDLFACKIISPMPFGFGEFLMCCGFLLMYLIEEIIHTWIHRRQKRRGAVAAFERGHSPRSSRIAQSGTENPAVSKENMNNSQYSSSSTVASITDSKECIISTDTATGSRPPKDMPHYNETTEHKSHAGHSHTHFPAGADDDTTASSLRGLLLVLALSLHELFEGLAIGLEDSPGAVWFTFGAVSAHKLVLAFCVGMELVVARTRPLLSVIYIITFSIVSPIGIAIGILVSLHSNNSEPSLAEAILQGIATGTLLYVVFFEILTTNHAGWWAYFSLFIGFLLMFGLQILGGEADAHSGSEYACAMNG